MSPLFLAKLPPVPPERLPPLPDGMVYIDTTDSMNPPAPHPNQPHAAPIARALSATRKRQTAMAWERFHVGGVG